MISDQLLIDYGAKKIALHKGEILFKVQETARNFYQIIEGEIKMNNFNDDGKEFMQGIFKSGKSFGEPPLFSDRPYPANAEAVSDSHLWSLKKEQFFKLLFDNPRIHFELTTTLAKRLHYKAMMASEISSQDPEHRLIQLIDYFKTHVHKIAFDDVYKVELSRQQMADLTGLRVETVIRSIKSLEKKGLLKIKSRKVYR